MNAVFRGRTSAATEAALEKAAELLGPLAEADRPMGELTTYRVGGPAALFSEPGTVADLQRVSSAVATTEIAVVVLGKGSNLLVSDAGFPGLCLRLADRFAGIEIEGDLVRAGGAAAYPVLARRTAAAGFTGLEWAVGIPGSVGGAVRMNAGGHGAQTSEVLVDCRIVSLLDGVERLVVKSALDLSYRHSSIGPFEVVTEASYRLERGDAEQALARIDEVVRWRREHQPGGQNAGSVFTNPPDDAAGRLIEEAGLKGLRMGSAVVSDKHANFIQADPGGSADDVRRLIDAVRGACPRAPRRQARNRAAIRGVRGGVMTDPRIQARRVKVERQRGHRRLRVLIGAVVLAGGVAGALAIAHSSLFSARTVVIAGAVQTLRSEILAVTGLDREPPLIDLNTGSMQRRLERLPWVVTASVHLDWPSTVAIAVVERVPVAATALAAGGYALLDATGRVLEDQTSRPSALPLVAVPGVPGSPGSSLGASAQALLATASQFPVTLLPRLQDIVASSADGVVLHLKGGLRAIVGDDEALAQKFVSLVTVLNGVNLTGVGGIDLRVAAAPVLTPLVSASNVHGKGDG